MRTPWAVVAAIAVLLTACSRGAPVTVVTLATTTSVHNSGLTEHLLPIYEQQTGVRARVVPVGSGRALAMLRDGQADAAITHAPAQEAAALAAHPGWQYRKVLYNDFLILGPPDDPAGAAKAAGAAEAMRRIAQSTSRFISRGDESGTHERERELWAAAGARPGNGRLVIAGAGMGDTLRIAGETASYTLSDRATFERLSPRLALRVAGSGDPVLLNTYAAIADPANAAGLQFARWLSGDAGRDAIARLLERGQVRGFTLWPLGRPGSRPDDRPR